jgi:hypothetical protein
MHKANIRPKRRKTVLSLVLALGVGLPSPPQGYLLDFTVLSINPGGLISYAGGYPSGPPLIGSNLKVNDVSRMGDLPGYLSPTNTILNKLLNFPAGAPVEYFSNVSSVTDSEIFSGLYPQSALALHGGIPALNMSDSKTLWSNPFETASVMQLSPVDANPFSYLAGSSFMDSHNDGLLAHFGIPRQTVDDNFNPGFSSPGVSVSTMVPSGNILNHLAPFSSTLLLLGCGLMGLAGLHYRRRRG